MGILNRKIKFGVSVILIGIILFILNQIYPNLIQTERSFTKSKFLNSSRPILISTGKKLSSTIMKPSISWQSNRVEAWIESKKIWSFQVLNSNNNSVFEFQILNGLLLFSTATETLYALDIATGEMIWSETFNEKIKKIQINGENLVVFNEDQNKYTLDTSGKILEVSKFDSVYINFYNELRTNAGKSLDLQKKSAFFFKKNNISIDLNIGHQENIEDHLSQSLAVYKAGKVGDIIFAPMGSFASDQIKISEEIKKKNFFMMQVTASQKFQKDQNAISTFLPNKDYLRGFPDLLKSLSVKPKRVFIYRNSNIGYFFEVENHINADLLKHKIDSIQYEIGTPPELVSKVKLQVNSGDDLNSDLFIFIDYQAEKYLRLFKDKNNKFAEKLIIYSQSSYIGENKVLPNTTYMFFWLPDLLFSNSLNISNCEFVRQFKQEFGIAPDFHAAYLYSSLEVALQLKKNKFLFSDIAKTRISTILGSMNWNSKGERTNVYPLYVRADKNLNLTLYTQVKDLKWCNEEAMPIHFF